MLRKTEGAYLEKHNLKFRYIDYNVDPYGQAFFPKSVNVLLLVRVMALFKKLKRLILSIYFSLDYNVRLHADPSQSARKPGL